MTAYEADLLNAWYRWPDTAMQAMNLWLLLIVSGATFGCCIAFCRQSHHPEFIIINAVIQRYCFKISSPKQTSINDVANFLRSREDYQHNGVIFWNGKALLMKHRTLADYGITSGAELSFVPQSVMLSGGQDVENLNEDMREEDWLHTGLKYVGFTEKKIKRVKLKRN